MSKHRSAGKKQKKKQQPKSKPVLPPQQQPLGKLPNVGDHVFVTIRSRCVKIGPDKTQLELEELFHNGISDKPLYLWAPTALISKQNITIDQSGLPVK